MEVNRTKRASRMVKLVQNITTIDIETNISVDLEGKNQKSYYIYLLCYNVIL